MYFVNACASSPRRYLFFVLIPSGINLFEKKEIQVITLLGKKAKYKTIILSLEEFRVSLWEHLFVICYGLKNMHFHALKVWVKSWQLNVTSAILLYF